MAGEAVVAAGKQVSTAEVQMGSSSNVGLVAPRQLTVTLPLAPCRR